ncbi:ETC complex I subunit conserved region-domain-containing protein [Rhypophila decipiens]|uniref:NADH dehydrogenase [ubiquinone] iron-sulfur protein 4, mitochondrial n=1 Tax=Rhypophila decipiens TaxID=261697 RepID=A0AAN6YG22_9PEZI|nr:ETC complex I subunit conserved region-domain-containing protein [Rhypophila decipiens]
MSSLRATASAARLLRGASQVRSMVPATRRFESTIADVPVTAKKEDSPLATPSRDSPDYKVPTDKATSNFTPVPKYVQDGSEDGILSAAVISGAPIELQARTVRIFQPAKPATQSGTQGGTKWRMDWDVLSKGHRWENELMGWQSSADAMQGTALNFKSKEDAIAFAEKQGYEYFVQEPNERAFTPKAYANNFLYSPTKLKHIRTK